MKASLALALGVAALAAVTATPAAAEKRALIVSINEYGRPQWKLRGAVADGLNIDRLLRENLGYRPDQIRQVFDTAATREGILSAFREWLVQGTQPGDDVFFYFSGHGFQQKDTDNDEEDGLDETLVAADAGPDGQGGVANMITDDEIDRLLGAIKDRRVTMVIDSCHSGTISRGAFGTVEGARSLPWIPEIGAPQAVTTRAISLHRGEVGFVAQKPGRMVWTAVAPYQQALEEIDHEPVSGVFTNRFINGVREKRADTNGDGVVSASELFAYVQKESDAYCRARPACKAGLTPMLETPAGELTTAVDGSQASGPQNVAYTPQPQPQPQPQQVQSSATALLANDNQGGVTLEVLPGSTARIGQAVRFRVSSRTEGALILLDANAAGELVQIYPNEHSQAQNRSGRIQPGRPITIPDPTYGFEFTASEPAGQGTLIALVLQDPVDVSALVNRTRDLTPIPAPVDHMARLAELLRKPWTDGATTRMTRWSMTSATYNIAR